MDVYTCTHMHVCTLYVSTLYRYVHCMLVYTIPYTKINSYEDTYI